MYHFLKPQHNVVKSPTCGCVHSIELFLSCIHRIVNSFPFISAMSSPTFTCITCRVAFADADLQRSHYKTDWHRYNLKRKVANLPHVTAEGFNQRVLAQRAQVSDFTLLYHYLFGPSALYTKSIHQH